MTDDAKLIERLRGENERLRGALSDLVKANERWNKSVQDVIGRVPGWSDSYLDAARAALSGDEGGV